MLGTRIGVSPSFRKPAAGGGLSPTVFYMVNPSSNTLARVSVETLNILNTLALGNHWAYFVGFDVPNQKVIIYRRFSGVLGWHTVAPDLGSSASLGQNDGAITEQGAGLVYNEEQGRLYYCNGNTNTAKYVTWPAGTGPTVLSTVQRYQDVCRDPLAGRLYWANQNIGLRISNDDGTSFVTWWTVSTALLRCRVDPVNRIAFALTTGKELWKIPILPNGDPDLANDALIYTSPATHGAHVLEIDPVLQRIYVYTATGPTRLGEIDYDGNVLRTGTSSLAGYRSIVGATPT